MSEPNLFDDATTSAPAPSHLFDDVLNGLAPVSGLDTETLVAGLERLNRAYRAGSPEVSDQRYDFEFRRELERRDPDHPFLNSVEPEPEGVFVGERTKLPVSMKSARKCYETAEVARFVNAVSEASAPFGYTAHTVMVRVTPKLDGIAGYFDGRLLTRGRNGYGTNVTHVLGLGVRHLGDGQHGPGEIVIERRYFDEVLAAKYGLSHPRNFCAGLLGAETLQDYHREALAAGVVHFVPYATLNAVEVCADLFIHKWERFFEEVVTDVAYLTDGAVVDVVDPAVREAMGETSDSPRWRVALKKNEKPKETVVERLEWATGRTGVIAPVAVLRPVECYGVTIIRATAHNIERVETLGIGPGAVVGIVRSGLVIPKIEYVSERSTELPKVENCPSCGAATVREGKFVFCPNAAGCPAQASAALQHWCATLTTINGFGPWVCDKLAAAGKTNLRVVYGMSLQDFVEAGISEGVAKNLLTEIDRSRRMPVSDAVWLAAFGIKNLGRGDARKLLAHIPLSALSEVSESALKAIPGFGEKTSGQIARDLQALLPTIRAMQELGFNLEPTPLISSESSTAGPLSGMTLVFTGTMTSGSRSDLENEARKLGASVGSSVTGKTTFLVTGDSVGASKTDKAAKLGVKVISEQAYRELIGAA